MSTDKKSKDELELSNELLEDNFDDLMGDLNGDLLGDLNTDVLGDIDLLDDNLLNNDDLLGDTDLLGDVNEEDLFESDIALEPVELIEDLDVSEELDESLDFSELIISDDGDLLSLPGEFVGAEDVVKGDLDSAINAEDDSVDENVSRDLIEKRMKQRNKADAKVNALNAMITYLQEFSAGYDSYYNGIIPVASKLRLEEIIKSTNFEFNEDYMLGRHVMDILIYFERSLRKSLRKGETTLTPEDIFDINISSILGRPVPEDITVAELTVDTFDINKLLSLLRKAEERIKESEEIYVKNTDRKKSLKNKFLDTYFGEIVDIQQDLEDLLDDIEKDEEVLETDLVFVDRINLVENSFVCGACGENVIDAKVPFYTNVMFPEDKNNSIPLYSLFGLNTCPACTSKNILSEQEMKEIHRAHRENKGNTLRNLESFHLNRDSSGNRTDDFSYTKYMASMRSLKNRIPGLFETSESTDVNNEVDLEDDRTNLAVQRYLDMLKFFKNNSKSPAVIDTISKVSSKDTLVKLEPLLVNQENLESFTDNPTDNKVVDSVYKHEILAKLICTVLNRDYNKNKENAINSFLAHIASTPYLKYLSHSNHAMLRGAKLSGTLLKDLGKLEGDKLLSNVADILSTFLIEEKLDLTTMSKSHLLSIVREEYSKLDTRIEGYSNKRKDILLSLNSNINNYAYLTISAIKLDKDLKLDLLQDDDFRYIVDIVSNKMIINTMSEEFFYTWFPTISTSATREIDAVKSTKDIIYNKVKNVLKDKLGFKDMPCVVIEGLYPDNEIMTCLELLLKLQNDLYIDEYKAILTCNELINSPSLVVFEELKKLESVERFVTDTISKYGKGDLSRLKYYLMPLGFSEKEIESAYESKYINIDFNRIIEREPNDTVKTYLDKYISIESKSVKKMIDKEELKAFLINLGFESTLVEDYINSNWDKYKHLDLNLNIKPRSEDNLPKYLNYYIEVQSRVEQSQDNWSKYNYVPYKNILSEMLYGSNTSIDSLFVIALSTVESNSVKNPGAFYGMITMLNTLLYNLDSEKLISKLGFGKEVVNGLLNSIPKNNYLNLNYEGYRDDIRILSYVYEDLRINDIVKGSDNVESRISRLLNEYKDSLVDYVDYLPSSDKEFVDNYRLARQFNPANIVLLED